MVLASIDGHGPDPLFYTEVVKWQFLRFRRNLILSFFMHFLTEILY